MFQRALVKAEEGSGSRGRSRSRSPPLGVAAAAGQAWWEQRQDFDPVCTSQPGQASAQATQDYRRNVGALIAAARKLGFSEALLLQPPPVSRVNNKVEPPPTMTEVAPTTDMLAEIEEDYDALSASASADEVGVPCVSLPKWDDVSRQALRLGLPASQLRTLYVFPGQYSKQKRNPANVMKEHRFRLALSWAYGASLPMESVKDFFLLGVSASGYYLFVEAIAKGLSVSVAAQRAPPRRRPPWRVIPKMSYILNCNIRNTILDYITIIHRETIKSETLQLSRTAWRYGNIAAGRDPSVGASMDVATACETYNPKRAPLPTWNDEAYRNTLRALDRLAAPIGYTATDVLKDPEKAIKLLEDYAEAMRRPLMLGQTLAGIVAAVKSEVEELIGSNTPP